MNALLNRIDILCDSCNAEFTVITKSEEDPVFCVYCGDVCTSNEETDDIEDE